MLYCCLFCGSSAYFLLLVFLYIDLFERDVIIKPPLEKSHSYHIWAATSEKNAFKYAQNVRIQVILRMCKVSSGPLLSIDTVYSILRFC